MNRLQEELLNNTNDLPKDFSTRMEESEKDIEEGRVKSVTPEQLFEEIGI